MHACHPNTGYLRLPLLLAVLALGACSVAADVFMPEVAPTPPSTAATNPFTGARLYVDPSASGFRQVNQWRASRPADAADLEKIAFTPQAIWIGDWFNDVQTATRDIVTQVTSSGALPVLVLYNIPQRDCGLYSAGGASGASAYRNWIAGVAN